MEIKDLIFRAFSE